MYLKCSPHLNFSFRYLQNGFLKKLFFFFLKFSLYSYLINYSSFDLLPKGTSFKIPLVPYMILPSAIIWSISNYMSFIYQGYHKITKILIQNHFLLFIHWLILTLMNLWYYWFHDFHVDYFSVYQLHWNLKKFFSLSLDYSLQPYNSWLF